MNDIFAEYSRRATACYNGAWAWRAMVALGLVSWCIQPAHAQFRELVERLPKSANSVLLLNVTKAVNSPMGVREGWKKKIEKSFEAGLIRVPPLATNYVIASQLDLEFMEPIWTAAVVDLSEAVSLPKIAERRRGTADSIDGLAAVALPNDTYLVRFALTTVGAMQPANRQAVTRWIHETQAGSKAELSSYLKAAAGYSDDAATDIIMAIDLDGALSWARAGKFLIRHKELLKQTDDERKDAATVLSDVQGVRLGIRLSDRPFGKLTVDFRTSPAALESVAKPLFLQAIADAGMKIDDLDDWKLEIGAQTISLSGNLTTSGLRRALAVIESPTTSESTTADTSSQSSPENLLSAEAKASQDHYRTVVGMFDDLKKDMGSVANLASTQTYFDKYAKRIERLPILNVDPDLLNYSAFVASSMRAASGAVRNMGIQSGVRQAQINSSNTGAAYADYSSGRYGVYGGYGTDRTAQAKGIETERRVVRAEEKGNAATNIQQIRAEVVAATADVRRKMTQKYKVEF
jgi:formate dehydrogenase maturation protein FdhE